MPAPRLPWVKLWVESMEHEKIEMLPDPLYRTWTRCLLRGSQQPVRWRFASVEHASRITSRPARHIRELIKCRLLDQADDGLWIHDWSHWQDRFPSDFTPRPPRHGSAKAPSIKEEHSGNAPVTLREDSGEHSGNAPDWLRGEGESEEDSESPPLNPPQPADGAASRAPDKPAQERGVRSAPVDALWAALDRECGKAATKSEIQVRVRVHRELAEVQATPEQLRSRAKAWHQRYPSTTLTDLALAKHWSSLGPKTASGAVMPATAAVPAVPVPEREPTPEERERQREQARRFLLPQLRKAKASNGGLSPALLASATPWFSAEELTEFGGGSAA